MDKRIILLLLAMFLTIISVCSCKTTKLAPTKEVRIDTIRIVSHDTIKITHHSVPVSVPLPTVYLSNVTKDTVSTLTDGLYKSVTSIKDGLLHHNLYTLPNAKVNTNVQANDTLKTHNINTDNIKIDSIPKPYPVVKEKVVYQLHWWQAIFVWIGIASSIIIGIYIIMWAIKKGLIHL